MEPVMSCNEKFCQCDMFVPQIWKPKKCTACFHIIDSHGEKMANMSKTNEKLTLQSFLKETRVGKREINISNDTSNEESLQLRPVLQIQTKTKTFRNVLQDDLSSPIIPCPKYPSFADDNLFDQCSWSLSQWSDPPEYMSQDRCFSAPSTPSLSHTLERSDNHPILKLGMKQTTSFTSERKTLTKKQINMICSQSAPGVSIKMPHPLHLKLSNLSPPKTPAMESQTISKVGSSPLFIPGTETTTTHSPCPKMVNNSNSPKLSVGAPRTTLFATPIKVPKPRSSPIAISDIPFGTNRIKAGSPGATWAVGVKNPKITSLAKTLRQARFSPTTSPVNIQKTPLVTSTYLSSESTWALQIKTNRHSSPLLPPPTKATSVPKRFHSSPKSTQGSSVSSTKNNCESLFVAPIPTRPPRSHRHVDGRNFQLQWLSHRVQSSTALVQDRWYRVKKYPQTLIGSELVDWLVKTKTVSSRGSAVSVGRSLVDSKYLRHVANERAFDDGYFFYTFLPPSPKSSKTLKTLTALRRDSENENRLKNEVPEGNTSCLDSTTKRKKSVPDRIKGQTLWNFVPPWLIHAQNETPSDKTNSLTKSKSRTSVSSLEHFNPSSLPCQVLRSTCPQESKDHRRSSSTRQDLHRSSKSKMHSSKKCKKQSLIPSFENFLRWSLSPLNICDIALGCLVSHGWRKIISNNFLHNKSFLSQCAYRNNGFPQSIRSRVWSYLVGADNTKWRERSSVIYQNLIVDCSIEDAKCNGASPITMHTSISNDINRTLVDDELLSTDAKQSMMLSILKTYAMHDTDVGYCQGMNFIVGLLVRRFKESDKTFFIFQNVMEGVWNLRSLYIFKPPGILKLNKRYDQLMAHYVPAVHRHIKKEQLIVDMFSTGWFITLFIPNVCCSLAEWIFDIFLVDGSNILLQIGLSLVSWLEPKLLKLTSGKLLSYLNHLTYKDFSKPVGPKETHNQMLDWSDNKNPHKNNAFFEHSHIIKNALKFDVNLDVNKTL